MAIQKEIWVNSIAEQLFQNSNQFLNVVTNHDGYAMNAAVNIPQAADLGSITKNRSVFPGVVTTRADSVLRYTLDSFSLDPLQVKNLDMVQLSYNKLSDITSSMSKSLTERMGLEACYAWAVTSSGSSMTRTSGTASAKALAPSGTGTRLALTIDDINACAAKLDADNVPQMGRSLVIPSSMWWEFLATEDKISRDYMLNTNLEVAGAVGKVSGFDVFTIPIVNVYDLNGDLKAIGAVAAASDCLGGLAFSNSSVCKALEGIKIFGDTNNPEYYGDVISSEVIFGASKKYSSGDIGICALVQTA